MSSLLDGESFDFQGQDVRSLVESLQGNGAIFTLEPLLF